MVSFPKLHPLAFACASSLISIVEAGWAQDAESAEERESQPAPDATLQPREATAPRDVPVVQASGPTAPPPAAPPPLSEQVIPNADEAILGSAALVPVSSQRISAVLSDAATDLGLTLSEPPRIVVLSGNLDQQPHWEDALTVPSAGTVTLAGAIERCEERWWLRVAILRDDATLHSVRLELDREDYEVQAIRALASLVRPTSGPASPSPTPERQPDTVKRGDTSQGKVTLATTGAALGGYFGFALENAGGNVDTRLVYPLVALGAGVGLASALIVTEEWPLDRPSAWYVSGGGLWLTLAGVMIASELDLRHPTDRYPYGLIGTGIGLGLSGYVVSQRPISEAEAVFSQSGALFGTIAGGFVQELVEPGAVEFPRLGIGVGAAGGWLLASLGSARWLPGLTSSRVLFADLGGFLGALVGAAAASPALVNRGPALSADRRAFVGASLSGLVLGSVVGYWLGGGIEEEPGPKQAPLQLRATSVAQRLPATPFEPVLPGFTAFSLSRPW